MAYRLNRVAKVRTAVGRSATVQFAQEVTASLSDTYFKGRLNCITRILKMGKTSPIAFVLAMVLSTITQSGAVAQSGVLPANFSQLSASWWKWALETPTPVNPLIDTTGANCAVNQSGSVWFLAGSFSGPAITRTCTVPAGKLLFIPIANSFCATGRGDPVPQRNAPFQRGCAKDFVDSATNLSAEIDGTPVQNISDYRVTAKAFALLLPADNIFGVPPGPYSPAAADGYYLPVVLPSGQHTIHVHAEFPDGPVDVTYILQIL